MSLLLVSDVESLYPFSDMGAIVWAWSHPAGSPVKREVVHCLCGL